MAAIPILFTPKQLKGKYCLSPFVQIYINTTGEVGLCGCSTWQPTPIGNIFEHRLQDLLAGEIAQNIRKSIIDGTYIYCHHERCGLLRTQQLNSYETLPEMVKWAVEDPARFSMPHHIALGLDNTCNLFCPSCRHQIIKNTDATKEKQQELSKLLTKNLFDLPTDKRIVLTLDTSGDVFSSPMLLDFLNGISSENFPNLEIDLVSNGLLAQDRWHRLGAMQNHVKQITVSYDSPDPATYEKLRRGGTWENLVRNLTWLQNKKKENNMRFNARMVVQRDNYTQMSQFYNFSKQFDVDEVQFQRILNFGTFTSAELKKVDVFSPHSEKYNDAVEQFKQVKDLPNAVFWNGFPNI